MEKRAKYFSKSWRAFLRLLLLLFCLNPIMLPAQNYPTRHYTMRDGLPSMGIRCIYKDSRGLLWIGTDAGLCSFDGQSFRIYKPNEGMTASQVWAITEDDEGNMWFGSFGNGLYKYDGRQFKNITTNDGLTDNKIRVMYYSKKYKLLMIGGTVGLTTVKNGEIKPFKNNSKNEEIRTVTGFVESENFIYIYEYHYTSPLRFYPDKNEVVSVADVKNYYRPGCACFISSKGDTVFTLNDYGISIFKEDLKVRNDSIGQVFGIDEDKRGNLWFVVWSVPEMILNGGIFRYNGTNFKNFKDEFGITDSEIWSVLNDNEQDILWIGTLNEGLFKVPFSSISEYKPKYFNLEPEKINTVFLDSDNKLWILNNKELIALNPDGSYYLIPKKPLRNAFLQFWNHPEQTPFNKELPFIYSKLNDVSSDNNKDFEKDKTKNLVDFGFNSITESQKNEIIFISKLGTYSFNKVDKRVKYLGPEGNNAELSTSGDTLISGNEYNISFKPRFREDRIKKKQNWGDQMSWIETFSNIEGLRNIKRLVKNGNRHWIASGSSGLWMIEGINAINFNKTHSTINNSVNDICFDERGNIIFGSNTGEIYIADYNNDSLKIKHRLGSEDGVQGNSISWLVADQKGKLWANTNRGLHCIDLDSLYLKGKTVIKFIDEEEGYTGQSSKRAVIDQSGNLWMGTGETLIKLNTEEFNQYKASVGKVRLTGLKINFAAPDSLLMEKLDVWTNQPNRQIELRPDQNNISFFFNVLNYNNSGKDLFRFKLQGYSDQWSEWSWNREANYTNLPEGKYVLAVESFNLRTSKNAELLEFDFLIKHHWYNIWFVQLAGIIIVIAIMVSVVRFVVIRRKNRQIEKIEVAKTIAQLETQALQAQMNPHFIFNCINGIQYYVLASKMDEALAYISDFSKVVRSSLENVSVNLVPLEKEIEFLTSYLKLELMRFEGKFHYKIACNNIENPCSVFLPPMLVQPYVENAVRHGFMQLNEKGHLSVVFEKVADDMLKCTITDNGVGREKSLLNDTSPNPEERLHSGSITEKRIKLFNPPEMAEKYKIEYTDLSENGISCGLKVELYIPMENEKGKF